MELLCRIVLALLWLGTLVGAAVGVSFLVMALGASGAPAQAAGAGLACACVVIPYVVTRAVEGILVGPKQRG
ncbi:hypothetical protein ABIE09_001736 [Lysobacter enzymogenes]|uniref:hypothetical protein n=1 Tax=Lysobacter enzymogenes TaxID=69 RepID=UPI00339782D7